MWSVALECGMAGGGSERGYRVGSGTGGLASHNEEGDVVVVEYLARYGVVI